MISHLLISAVLAALAIAGPGEILTNRDFENKEDHMTGWSVREGTFTLEDSDPVHPANPHYILIKASTGTTLTNDCGGGVRVRKGEILSLDIHVKSSVRGKMAVMLVAEDGSIAGANSLTIRKGGWNSYRTSIQAMKASEKCWLDIILPPGTICVDTASLVSKDNYK